MALSYSRSEPAAVTSTSVADARFSTARRGFDQNEVRAFLQRVAAELGRLTERERFLQEELRVAQEHAVDPEVALDEETVTRLVGEETLRVLQTARESASQIRVRAEESAARIVREATEEADRLRAEAETEAARTRSDASADAEAELALAKQQGREMVNEARAYRERVLAELGRRREAARQQIEQLASGRDRLLQVFERARLVAVDVMSDLAPLDEPDEPDEYVDLSPTTGPIPLVRDDAATNGTTPEGDVASIADDEVAAVADDEVAADEPVADAEPVAEDEPEAEDEPGVEDEPVVEDELVAEEEPVAEDEPALEATSEDDVEPVADVDPVAEEEEPVAEDEPTVDERPEQSEDEDVTRADEGGARDGNVVSLFERLRAEAAAADAGAAAAETRPDVDETTGPEAPVDTGTGTDDDGTGADDAGTDETIFERRDADLVPLITASARKLKRVLADEQNDVLDRLRQRATASTLDDVVPEQGPHVERYTTAVAAELVEAARAGARQIDPGAGDLADEALVPARALIADALVEPLRGRLERAVIDGDGANDEIAKRVRAVYREWKTTHIDEQLDDVLRLAHGAGAMAAVTPGTPMCWSVDPNGPACPDAEDNALAGAVPAGEAYPTGHRVAPAHPGCRCLITPTGN